ncbi:MAG: hypothetical protein QW702_08790 [Candidatus Bathyarchaeia archaeon]
MGIAKEELSLELKEAHLNEIYGSLEFLGLDAEGNIHLIISRKSNTQTFISKLKILKFMFEGKEIVLSIREFKRK